MSDLRIIPYYRQAVKGFTPWDPQSEFVAVYGLKLVEDPAKRGNWKIEIWGNCLRLPVRCTQTGAGTHGRD